MKKTMKIRNRCKTVRYSNNKLIREYHDTYNRYMQTCDRYDQLVRAYTALIHSKKEASLGERPDALPENISQIEKNLRRMIKKTHIEKNAIAEHARECLRNLRKRKEVRVRFRADSGVSDQWA